MRRHDHEMTDSSHLWGMVPLCEPGSGLTAMSSCGNSCPPTWSAPSDRRGCDPCNVRAGPHPGLTRLWRHPSCRSGLSGCATHSPIRVTEEFSLIRPSTLSRSHPS